VWESDNPLVTRLRPLVSQIETHSGGRDVRAAFGLTSTELESRLAVLENVKRTAVGARALP